VGRVKQIWSQQRRGIAIDHTQRYKSGENS
jgi:hypothetical protein